MFQYVSIISVSTPAKFAILTKFTFQYVSIISDLKIKYLKQRSHLHSNMFLLFLACESSKMHSTEFHLHSNMFLLFPIFLSSSFYPTKIYIPICFYYFKLVCSPFLPEVIFTFQYVSIISTVQLTEWHSRWNLHSNMFLLFPR